MARYVGIEVRRTSARRIAGSTFLTMAFLGDASILVSAIDVEIAMRGAMKKFTTLNSQYGM